MWLVHDYCLIIWLLYKAFVRINLVCVFLLNREFFITDIASFLVLSKMPDAKASNLKYEDQCFKSIIAWKSKIKIYV